MPNKPVNIPATICSPSPLSVDNATISHIKKHIVRAADIPAAHLYVLIL